MANHQIMHFAFSLIAFNAVLRNSISNKILHINVSFSEEKIRGHR